MLPTLGKPRTPGHLADDDGNSDNDAYEDLTKGQGDTVTKPKTAPTRDPENSEDPSGGKGGPRTDVKKAMTENFKSSDDPSGGQGGPPTDPKTACDVESGISNDAAKGQGGPLTEPNRSQTRTLKDSTMIMTPQGDRGGPSTTHICRKRI